jgi:hypothetical protein
MIMLFLNIIYIILIPILLLAYKLSFVLAAFI